MEQSLENILINYSNFNLTDGKQVIYIKSNDVIVSRFLITDFKKGTYSFVDFYSLNLGKNILPNSFFSKNLVTNFNFSANNRSDIKNIKGRWFLSGFVDYNYSVEGNILNLKTTTAFLHHELGAVKLVQYPIKIEKNKTYVFSILINSDKEVEIMLDIEKLLDGKDVIKPVKFGLKKGINFISQKFTSIDSDENAVLFIHFDVFYYRYFYEIYHVAIYEVNE